MEYDIIIDRPSSVDTSDPCFTFLSEGGSSKHGSQRADVCNFEYRLMKRNFRLGQINTQLAAVDANAGRGGNVPYSLSDASEIVTPSLSYWNNLPIVGEDTGQPQPFNSWEFTRIIYSVCFWLEHDFLEPLVTITKPITTVKIELFLFTLFLL